MDVSRFLCLFKVDPALENKPSQGTKDKKCVHKSPTHFLPEQNKYINVKNCHENNFEKKKTQVQ